MSTVDRSAGENAGFAAFLAVKRFGSLDGLRCLSILAVLWHHGGIHVDFPLFSRGQLGVHLFFAISGFLITSLMIRERNKFGQIDLRQFYVRRSLRIFPLYYAVLLVYVAVVGLLERDTVYGREFFKNLPAFATYTSNWFVNIEAGERVIFYYAWSLAAEEQFYLTWPWLERYLRPIPKFTVLVSMILIVLANRLGLLLWAFPDDTLGHRILWGVAPCILLGVLCAHIVHCAKGFEIAKATLGRVWSAPMMLLAVITFASIGFANQAWQFVIYLSLVGLVMACTIREDNGLAKLLRLRLIVRIGVVSYGIYLMHMLCFNAVRKIAGVLGVLNPWLLWIMGIVLVYLVAELSFHTFERFFQNLKSRYARS